MKIRVSGTVDELNVIKGYFNDLEFKSFVKSVECSKFYQNRGSSTVYRLYIDIEYHKDYTEAYFQNLRLLGLCDNDGY